MTDRHELGVQLGLDRVLAHQVLFAGRHRDRTPHFHIEMIRDWHGPKPRVLTMAFRGGAKSTIAEEAIIIKAGYREFKNCVIIGEVYERAADRVNAIKHEIETNEALTDLFGDMIGPTWGDGELVLSNNVRIMALGRGQAMRGVKFQDQRPDAVFCDDLENEDSVRTKEARAKTKKWFMTTLMPALDPVSIIRVAATPLDADALAEDLRRDPAWETKVYPIEYIDEAGERRATWPARYNLEAIEALRSGFLQKGMLREFNMEYMCTAVADSDRAFKASMFRTEPVLRSWQAVYGMFDPARTVNVNSATTGFAAWSWVGNRLVVWDSWARKLMPNEIINAIFAFADEYAPTWIGVEEDGLNEFLLQPIRQEQVRRGQAIPLRPMRAPKGKLDFIKGLQPFFNAREIIFSQKLVDLVEQLLAFPTGAIDAPNALAYALKMRPGAPIYDGFGSKFIAEDLSSAPHQPCYLCLNATRNMVTGMLVQLVEGAVRIYADFVREGDAGEWVASIVQDAQVEAGRAVRLICGPQHFDRYTNVGLVQAIKALPAEARRGVAPEIGRAQLRSMMALEIRGMPALLVSPQAAWVLNALAGGYSRAMAKGGILADYAEEGVYRVLCEGLETFVGLMRTGVSDDERDNLNYAYTPGGQRYVSALVRR